MQPVVWLHRSGKQAQCSQIPHTHHALLQTTQTMCAQLQVHAQAHKDCASLLRTATRKCCAAPNSVQHCLPVMLTASGNS